MLSATIFPVIVWGAFSITALAGVDVLLSRRYGKSPQYPASAAAKDTLFAAAYSVIPAVFAVILWYTKATFELHIIAQLITAISCAGALLHLTRALFSRIVPQLPRALLALAAAISILCCAYLTVLTGRYTLHFTSECPRPVMYYPSPVLPLFPMVGEVESGSFGIIVPPGETRMNFDGTPVLPTQGIVLPIIVPVTLDKNCAADVPNVKIRIRL